MNANTPMTPGTRPPRRAPLAVTAAFSALGLLAMACGAPAEETRAEAPAATAPGANEADDIGLWASFASSLEGAREAEWFTSLAAMAAESDAVVLGTVREIRQGRVSKGVPGVPDLPFADYLISVESEFGAPPLRQPDGTVLLEEPFMPSSPELKAAIEEATDDEAMWEAYQRHIHAAMRQTIERMNADRPTAQTIFFLRRVPELPQGPRPGLKPGTYRIVNGSGLIANVNGRAVLPLRLEPAEDPIGAEALGRGFAEVLAAVAAARQ